MQFSPGQLEDKSGLVVLLIAIALAVAVNAHDLVAHMAGIDYCVALVKFDPQLAFVEFSVPVVYMIGSVLGFTGILLLLIQMEKGYSYRLEKHALNLLIAGPVFWVIGSIHNLCQVYERLNGRAQMLQKSVQIPFLMGSLLFLIGGFFNRHNVNVMMLRAKSWIWLCLFGSLLFFIGGLFNVVKVFKMQQVDGVRLEKLRGGALERLIREREGKAPLILEENGRRQLEEEPRPQPPVLSTQYKEGQPPVNSTPYKDVLVGGSSQV